MDISSKIINNDLEFSVERVCEQLCEAVTEDFEFKKNIRINSYNETAQKLSMLSNYTLNMAYRSVQKYKIQAMELQHAEEVSRIAIKNLKESHIFQEVLLAELQHRSRNLLTIVLSTMRATSHRRSSLNDFMIDFEGRICALSRVQGLLARTNHEMIDLRELVEAELAAHIVPEDSKKSNKTVIDGPPVTLCAVTIQILALALHELTTNSVKYGALSQKEARLSVTWWIEQDDINTHVHLKWVESGVNFLFSNDTKISGYGRELIERALPYQLKAKTHFKFCVDGVNCLIILKIYRDKVENDKFLL